MKKSIRQFKEIDSESFEHNEEKNLRKSNMYVRRSYY